MKLKWVEFCDFGYLQMTIFRRIFPFWCAVFPFFAQED